MLKYIAFLLLIAVEGNAQLLSTAKQFSSQLDYFKKNNPCEKLFLKPNRDVFFAGDNLWYTGFLVDCDNLKFSGISQSINVYLLDSKSNVVATSKVLNQDGKFKGDLIIPDTLNSGIYELIAFSTLQRQTQTEDYYFRSHIDVIDKRGGNLEFRIIEDNPIKVLINTKNGGFVNGLSFDCEFYNSDGYLFSKTYITNQNGEAFIERDNNITYVILRSRYLSLNNTFYYKIKKPSSVNLKFFPKSGSLVKELPAIVFFKVSDDDQNPLNTEVRLLKENIIVDTIQTNDMGIGMVNFYKYPNENMSLQIVLDDSIISYKFPNPTEKGTLFDYRLNNKSLVLNIYSNIDTIQNVYLIGHVRGKLQIASLINFKIEYTEVLDIQGYDPGILELVLFDENGITLSNANVFLKPQINDLILEVDEGEKMNSLSAKPDSLSGWFGLRVNDKDYINNHQIDLHTYLILDADLTTHFSTNSQSNNSFNILNPNRFKWFLERKLPDVLATEEILGQETLRGKATYKNGQPLSEKELILYKQDQQLKSWISKTNSSGEFYFEEFESSQESNLILSALNVKRNRKVEFEIYEDSVNLNYRFRNTLLKLKETSTNINDSIDFTDALVLQNVTKKGGKYIESVEERREKLDRVKSVKGEDLQISAGGGRWGILSILQQVTSIYSWNSSTGQVLLRAPQTFSAGSGVIFYLDNTRLGDNMFNLNFLSLEQIDEIKIYRPGPDAAQFPFASDGVIQIITKKGYNPTNEIKGKHLKVVDPIYSRIRDYDIIEADAARDNSSNPTLKWYYGDCTQPVFEYLHQDKDHQIEFFGITNDDKIIHQILNIQLEN